jgi:hypothetical protein
VGTLGSRQVEGQSVGSAAKIQAELRFSAAGAEALLTTVREYYAGKADIGRAVRRAIFERRMQVIAGNKVTFPTEAEIVAQGDRRTNVFLGEKMAELRGKVGETAFQDLARFIDAGAAVGQLFPLREGEAMVAVIRN